MNHLPTMRCEFVSVATLKETRESHDTRRLTETGAHEINDGDKTISRDMNQTIHARRTINGCKLVHVATPLPDDIALYFLRHKCIFDNLVNDLDTVVRRGVQSHSCSVSNYRTIELSIRNKFARPKPTARPIYLPSEAVPECPPCATPGIV